MPNMPQESNAQPAPETPDKPDQTPTNDLTGQQPKAEGNRAAQDGGPRNAVASGNSFIQLPPRDRAALEQSQSEKYPQEYGPLVEQYLKNLSDTPDSSPAK